jgi:hypothetical protein
LQAKAKARGIAKNEVKERATKETLVSKVKITFLEAYNLGEVSFQHTSHKAHSHKL